MLVLVMLQVHISIQVIFHEQVVMAVRGVLEATEMVWQSMETLKVLWTIQELMLWV